MQHAVGQLSGMELTVGRNWLDWMKHMLSFMPQCTHNVFELLLWQCFRMMPFSNFRMMPFSKKKKKHLRVISENTFRGEIILHSATWKFQYFSKNIEYLENPNFPEKGILYKRWFVKFSFWSINLLCFHRDNHMGTLIC